ncbi:helix-hairpin-helix domain-containing protein [Agriterribacter humi]|jgi:competence ComEA-like helix-hairpin-helix protein|uniref:helix-hairpin-helix domain-containing protein n=1 Tax=Agriterribacter humi TaxID=1104781 RepID=UPI0012641D36|nr:helix-hairpin-helix domain-containing protein [Agriterribacter humi]
MNANQLKEYFNFSKKERNGIIVLLVMLAGVWFAPLLFIPDETFDVKEFARFEHDIAQLRQESVQTGKDNDSGEIFYPVSSAISYRKQVKAETFYFDPNTLKPMEWQRLGIPGRTIQTIQNFIAKGGRFYKAEDIGKIYGLRKPDYERLLPYVRIAANASQNKEKKIYPASFAAGSTKYTVSIVHINTADTTAFIALPGIGSKLAIRIISFREKLGGFYNVEQVAEVFGLSDSVFQQIRPRLQCNAGAIKKININTAGIDELKAHPYIKYQVGNAVIQYRLQHGNFQNEEDLKQVHLVTDDLIQKLLPYINY